MNNSREITQEMREEMERKAATAPQKELNKNHIMKKKINQELNFFYTGMIQLRWDHEEVYMVWARTDSEQGDGLGSLRYGVQTTH